MRYALDERSTVMLNGAPQSIRLRGTDSANPVLLFLHGGPGVCDRHRVLKFHSALADAATLALWDQRGAGKSYNNKQAKETLSVDMMVEDARALVEYLCERFGKEKLYIVGHSWGSLLGTLLAQRYPSHIAAYVGMGQVTNLPENERISYEFVLEEAKKRSDSKGLSELSRIGAPVNGQYKTLDDLVTQRNYLSKYGGGLYNQKASIWSSMILPLVQSSEYTPVDWARYAKGSFYSLRQLWGEISQLNFMETVPKLDVPVYITQGRHDLNAPSLLAREWFDRLEAPYKEWIWFEQSAHSPIVEEPARWQAVIREKLFQK